LRKSCNPDPLFAQLVEPKHAPTRSSHRPKAFNLISARQSKRKHDLNTVIFREPATGHGVVPDAYRRGEGLDVGEAEAHRPMDLIRD
jgi:hypothetical protein